MCGIAGFANPRGFSDGSDARRICAEMISSLKHRGPDSSGIWLDESEGVALGHRRLAILDLSESGHQPMSSNTSRFTIVFNGEIYNHRELRDRLAEALRYAFRGTSDTETLLAGFEAWGIKGTFERTKGMFAAAVWDRDSRTLSLARDRFGEKPLSYGWLGGDFVFASELQALKAHPEFRPEIDVGSLSEFLKFGYVPGPASILTGVSKLRPGHILVLDRTGNVSLDCFWRLQDVVRSQRENPFSGTDAAAVDQFESTLSAAVERQLISDVPLGAFLSGGIDSSLIVATMNAVSSEPVRTFTIAVEDSRYNEGEIAKAVAGHLGTKHTEMYIQPEDLVNLAGEVPDVYDEPFADASQIPTLLVSRLARREVAVALSGDGGDEMFAGYERQAFMQRFWPTVSKVPMPIRRMLAVVLSGMPPRLWEHIAGLPAVRSRVAILDQKAGKLIEVIRQEGLSDVYDALTGRWFGEPPLLGAISTQVRNYDDYLPPDVDLEAAEKTMILDAIGYLPDDILVKVDRAAMSISLETRAPYLDPDICEFAWSLPLRYKLRGKESKWILRELLRRYIPGQLIDRPKQGFALPIGDWLRGPLKSWVLDQLDMKRLQNHGHFSVDSVNTLVSSHLSGAQDHAQLVWRLLMFQAWFSNFCDAR